MKMRYTSSVYNVNLEDYVIPNTTTTNFIFGVMSVMVYAFLKCWPKYQRQLAEEENKTKSSQDEPAPCTLTVRPNVSLPSDAEHNIAFHRSRTIL